MQKYKVFYKSNEIVFCATDHQIDKKPDVHVLLNPLNNQIIAALKACFHEPSEIKTLCIMSHNPDNAFSQFVNSLFYIEAAGGIVMNELNEWLMIKRIGVWDLPKGKVDAGETVQQAALREVKEETGIESVSIVKPLSPSYHIYPMDEEWVFKKTHWFLMLGSKNRLKPQKEENISEAVWMNKETVKKILKNVYPSLLHVFEEAGILIEM